MILKGDSGAILIAAGRLPDLLNQMAKGSPPKTPSKFTSLRRSALRMHRRLCCHGFNDRKMDGVFDEGSPDIRGNAAILACVV